MDISRKTYQSKTGYVTCIAGTYYEAKTIYLGKYDKAENYEDISKDVYSAYLKAEHDRHK